jgi:PAS domain S-box-containing protein
MNDVTLNGPLLGGMSLTAKAPVARPVFVNASVILAVGVGLSLWGCFRAPGTAAALQFVKVVGPAIAGACICVTIMVVRMRRWQQSVSASVNGQIEEWKKIHSALQVQLLDQRREVEHALRRQEDAQARVTTLVSEKERLKEELESLKKNERTLSQKRQALESTKTVLELHVQERSAELQRLQREYELILNAAGEGICGLDSEGMVTFVNPAAARLTGWSVEELVGKTERDFFGEHSAAPEKASGERMLRRKDGSSLPVEFIRTQIEEGSGFTGTVLVFKDIAKRKEVEEGIAQKAAELARSNAELEQFAFVASHDLQEPLRKILAFGDRLKMKVEGAIAPEAREYLDRMQNAAARMRTLIDDLLAFSRVIRSSEAFKPVDLSSVIKGVLGDLEVRIEKTGAKIETSGLPTLEADPMQMHQLFLNLIANALKFQAPGGKPAIKVAGRPIISGSGQEWFEISVQDNGIGFDEKYLDKVFAVFQRLHGRNEYDGTGIGLAVCRRITDRHHGTITARSKPGEGATFLCTLPARQNSQLLK